MVVLTELLPESFSSSSSSSNQLYQLYQLYDYDVFLSFRGADTRNRFTDHLYNALLDAGYKTFLDDAEIETGEPLKPELENAIKSSRASVIVLSKNYASSTWCLDELVLILEQKRNCNQIAIPIFYDVEPTDVRKQQRSFGDAMEKHKERMQVETDAEKRNELAQKMESWRRALTQVADLKGKDNKDKKETEFIKEVIADINHRLRVPLRNTLPSLIGRDHYIESISSWLIYGSYHTSDILTIVGMSGIGKTSLARFVFGLHFFKFHKSSFIEGINARRAGPFNGLLDVQKQLCGDISKNIRLQVHDVSVYTSNIENALARDRVFIVLDDIGSLEQLDALLGKKGLHPGSKVIITTKDASLTERCALFDTPVQPKHKLVSLNGLNYADSLQLLCNHTFKSQWPKKGYQEVSEKLVNYCDGHPLALQVLGSALQKRDLAYWEECIEVLKKEPHSRINKALTMSFNSLQFKNDKELFKHIACFFVGMDREMTETILNACDMKTRYGITNLIDKQLLSIRENNTLMMHQLVQEMGRDLVRQESPEKPWKRSRLWCPEESLKVLTHKKGKGNILGLAFDMRMLDKKNSHGSFVLETKSLRKMDDLMLLQLNYVHINGCFKNFPEELRWLCMHGSPLTSVHFDLPMENLVVLDMSNSNIESFNLSYRIPQPPLKRQKGLTSSKNRPLLGSLKILDLCFCEQLHSVGGFSELPALERLIVRNCISLVEVCESIEQCVELVHIDMSYCYKLRNLPVSLRKLENVDTILLEGCSSSETPIETIPTDLKLLTLSLPSSLKLLSLSDNNLCNESFPMDLSSLFMLEELRLDTNPIVSMPDCVRTLPRLKRLIMWNCGMLKSIVNPPRTLTKLLSGPVGPTKLFSISEVKFNPEMSPLDMDKILDYISTSPVEIEGVIKIQSMIGVEEKLLQSLGWTNLEFIKERRMRTSTVVSGLIENETQMNYEFGIFSTFYEVKEMPEWIRYRTKGPEISFTIPSSPYNLRGLNFCFTTEEKGGLQSLWVPLIRICNIAQNYTWIYKHHVDQVELEGHYLCFLSHWMFGPNEMKAGDHITINVSAEPFDDYQDTLECGIGVVYDEDTTNEEEEEDVLGYYKSWNHIIGGNLSGFQLTTGEYILHNREFMRSSTQAFFNYLPFINPGAMFKEEEAAFKAFSEKKRSAYEITASSTPKPSLTKLLQLDLKNICL